MKLKYSNETIEKDNAVKNAVDQYNDVKYGLKYYVWSLLDRSALLRANKNNGVYNQYLIAKGKRQENGFYSKDEVDWDAYNKQVWNDYSNDFEEQMGLKETVNSIKEIAQEKRKLIMYFLENYGHNLNLEIKTISFKGTLSTESGITINYKNTQFNINSPEKTLIITVKGGIMEMINKTENTNIKFTIKSVDLFQEMLRLAELIGKDPKQTLEDPYNYLGIDPEITLKIQTAQEFLIEQNKINLAKANERKAKTENKQLTHDNYAKKELTVNISKRETIDEKKADAQAYKWKNFKIIDSLHYYGVRAINYLNWLTNKEINAKLYSWKIEIEKEFQNILSIDKNDDEFITIDTDYNKLTLDEKDLLLIWIPEEEFQVFNSCK